MLPKLNIHTAKNEGNFTEVEVLVARREGRDEMRNQILALFEQVRKDYPWSPAVNFMIDGIIIAISKIPSEGWD